METVLLKSLVLVFVLSIVVLYICQKIKIPTILAFLLIGVLAGPNGFSVIKAVSDVEVFADVGIILLLFTIGIEFSLSNLFRIKKAVFLGGSLEVAIVTLVTFFVARFYGMTIGESIFLGFLVSLSSTAIVLKLMQERSEVDSPHGLITLGILIFQDIAVVPMLLLIPILVGKKEYVSGALAVDIVMGLSLVFVTLISARRVVPRLLASAEKTGGHELFLLTTITICFAVAWLTSMIGLSLAIGAFLAGLIISESEHKHKALGGILPFRDIFTSIFFISIGMLLNITYFIEHMWIVIFISLGVLILKTVIAGTVTALLGFPFRINMLVGLAVSQIGEFSFILLKAGLKAGLMGENIYQLFIAVSVITMAATPLIIGLAPHAVKSADRLPMPKWFKSGLYKAKELKDD